MKTLLAGVIATMRTPFAAARRIIEERLRHRADGFLVREAGDLPGISRKYSIPLLEYLDTIGFTRCEAIAAGSCAITALRLGNWARKPVLRSNVRRVALGRRCGGDRGLVALLVFKTSGPPQAGGGFDSHPPPPTPPFADVRCRR